MSIPADTQFIIPRVRGDKLLPWHRFKGLPVLGEIPVALRVLLADAMRALSELLLPNEPYIPVLVQCVRAFRNGYVYSRISTVTYDNVDSSFVRKKVR